MDETDDSSDNAKPRKGDKVEARCKGSTRYYPGEVFVDNRDGTYDVKFDDGDRDRAVPERSIRKQRAIRSPSRGVSVTTRVGDAVDCNFKSRGTWLKGKVKRVNRDGSVDIDYDNGQIEFGVMQKNMRKRKSNSSGPSTKRPPLRRSIGPS